MVKVLQAETETAEDSDGPKRINLGRVQELRAKRAHVDVSTKQGAVNSLVYNAVAGPLTGIHEEWKSSSGPGDRVVLDPKIKRRVEEQHARRSTSSINEFSDVYVEGVNNRIRFVNTIHPSNINKRRWDWFILFCIAYHFYTIPWNVAVAGSSDGGRVFDYLVDFIFLVDMFLSFKSGFYDAEHNAVLDPELIKKNYMARWFTIDMICIIPFDLFIAIAAGGPNPFIEIARIPRCIRAFKLVKRVNELTKSGTGVRLLKLIATFVSLAHALGCAWFWMGNIQKEGNVFQGKQWLQRYAFENVSCAVLSYDQFGNNRTAFDRVPESSQFYDDLRKPYEDYCLKKGFDADRCFNTGNYSELCKVSNTASFDETLATISGCCREDDRFIENIMDTSKGFSDLTKWDTWGTSLYWAMNTMLTVGYGDIVPVTTMERSWAMTITLLGTTVYAVIFGNIGVLIHQLEKGGERYRFLADMTNEFAVFFKLPPRLRSRISQYVKATWLLHRKLDPLSVLYDCPVTIKMDAMSHIFGPIVQRVPLFQGFSDNFIKSMSMYLTPQVCVEGDYIVRERDLSSFMFIIEKGRVKVVSGKDEVLFAVLSEGSFLGEEALLGGPRTASVKAIDVCVIIYRIESVHLTEVLKFYPEYMGSIRENAAIRAEEMAAKRTKTRSEKAGVGSPLPAFIQEEDEEDIQEKQLESERNEDEGKEALLKVLQTLRDISDQSDRLSASANATLETLEGRRTEIDALLKTKQAV